MADRPKTVFRHPLTALGGALTITSVLALISLLIVDLSAPGDNPYRAIITFIAVPSLLLVGLGLLALGALLARRQGRQRGEALSLMLRMDFGDPRFVKSFWIFLSLLLVFVVASAFGSYRAFHATESVAFCGETCHTVMSPQFVTYQQSPHARVACVDCHIGPGATFWVRSKISGLRQVWAVLTNRYPRPIPVPIENLRPAQDTCEQCHWPQQFYGAVLRIRTHYLADQANSPWTIAMLLNIGGGNPRTGGLEGIHWHMNIAQQVEYIATDRQRQVIPWVRATSGDGVVTVYQDGEQPLSPAQVAAAEVRLMDCLDCHNRPSHIFDSPVRAVNLALSSGRIDASLPHIRRQGVLALLPEYESVLDALAGIERTIRGYYREQHPELGAAREAAVEQAIAELQKIYQQNFFPGMRTDWRVRGSNLGHLGNAGCFRCHNGKLRSDTGRVIRSDCAICHTIIAQGPSADLGALPSSAVGLEYQHPVPIGDAWQTMACSTCHTKDWGY